MKFFSILFFLIIALSVSAQDDDYVSLQERLKSNIFLKVDASSTDCYVGEPIIVTYKLYSAIASESNIIKNPGFSGFDVKNIMTGGDDIASRESVDGVVFDVHTILKLQLTPHTSGKLTLGSLVMRNRVKLVDANGNEDPLLDGVKEGYSLSNGYYSLNVSSVPITVLVTGLPNTSQPASTSGLVGDFKMSVQTSKNIYAPGEQGALTITIIGTGDFNKVKQPEIKWPDGVEVLPVKVDRDKNPKPDGSGYISYRFPFKSDKPGKYTIPSVKFSFFDALTGNYKTITNIPLEFSVVEEGAPVMSSNNAEGKKDYSRIILIGIGAALALLLLLLFIGRNKKKQNRPKPAAENIAAKQKAPQIINIEPVGIDEVLKPAADTVNSAGNSFYTNLKQTLVKYFEIRFGLPTALFNKESLKTSMTNSNIPAEKQKDILALLTEIDMNIYSGGGIGSDRQNLLSKARNILNQL